LNFVELGFPEMPAALAAHRIDAAFVTEPLVSSAVRRNLGRVIGKPYDAIAPQFTISGWFTLKSWARANPVLVRKVSAIFRQTSVWANTHDADSAQMLSTLTKLPLDVVGTMTRSRFAESMTAKNFQPIIDVAAKYGYLSKSFPASDMIDPSAV
jgi:NitT/TauT family transport system substrate-binding protein